VTGFVIDVPPVVVDVVVEPPDVLLVLEVVEDVVDEVVEDVVLDDVLVVGGVVEDESEPPPHEMRPSEASSVNAPVTASRRVNMKSFPCEGTENG
jgi:hypothetical protein